MNTFAPIKYELDQLEWIGSFRSYATSGQLFQSLAQTALGETGLFSWKGTDG